MIINTKRVGDYLKRKWMYTSFKGAVHKGMKYIAQINGLYYYIEYKLVTGL